MKIDIRIPIGALFSTIGLILALYGAFSEPSLYERSLTFNLNLSWGIVLFSFGALMLLLSWRASRARAKLMRDAPEAEGGEKIPHGDKPAPL